MDLFSRPDLVRDFDDAPAPVPVTVNTVDMAKPKKKPQPKVEEPADEYAPADYRLVAMVQLLCTANYRHTKRDVDDPNPCPDCGARMMRHMWAKKVKR